MVLKLYSDPRIFAGGGAIFVHVLAEKRIPFQHIPVSVADRQNTTPEYLAIQPFGQVPAIDDDGFILYESRAICRYLAEKYQDQGTPLLPQSLKERALFEQAAFIELANFHPYCQTVNDEAFGKPRRGLLTDQTILASAIALASGKLGVYETILGKHRHQSTGARPCRNLPSQTSSVSCTRIFL
ncbi:Glutathione S-transferase [Mycena venus]|uniref:glutathione transferase n=1 Tax=Mycena venus TaxID=2733690 RepID=A0A8H6YJW4_9AGAR|nr:Glutathione S-transferase [Mycena venus]